MSRKTYRHQMHHVRTPSSSWQINICYSTLLPLLTVSLLVFSGPIPINGFVFTHGSIRREGNSRDGLSAALALGPTQFQSNSLGNRQHSSENARGFQHGGNRNRNSRYMSGYTGINRRTRLTTSLTDDEMVSSFKFLLITGIEQDG